MLTVYGDAMSYSVAQADAGPQVTLDLLLSKIRMLKLDAHCSAIADAFLDQDILTVPVRDTAKLLRDAGVASEQAIAVRDALLSASGTLAPVCCSFLENSP